MDGAQRRSGVAVPLLLLLAAAPSFFRAEARAGAAGMTELQKHVGFFDRDHNGVLTTEELYHGLKSIGMGAQEAKTNAAAISAALGPKTRPDKSNSSSMDIYIANIYKGIHGSDTGAYNPRGRFVPGKLSEMFNKYGKARHNAMTEAEIDVMLKANRDDKDFQGWASSEKEWTVLYKLAKGKDGFLPKDTARAVYDGTLFYQLAAKGKTD